MPTRRLVVRALVGLYLVALAASHLARRGQPEAGWLAPDETVVMVAPAIRIAVLHLNPDHPGTPVVVLHGSPGDKSQVGPLSRALATRHRVIAPDLPGFGGSTRSIPDYSISAHATWLAALLDSMRVNRAHLVGYSMGGGVAVLLADRQPERVASLSLVSSIGVQEFELLGDYHLNHAVHALQLGGLWALRELVPHFGWMDDVFLSVPYARNFYDTDQRPLRPALERWDGPALIVQGSRDELVPPAIATEHGRIVPQSEVRMLDGGHFMVFVQAAQVADTIAGFLARVDAALARVAARGDTSSTAEAAVDLGVVMTRMAAAPERLAAAAQPFDPGTIPKPVGFTLAFLLILLAASTLVSEDLACIAAGLLESRGTLGFVPATLACLIGIAVGDLLLFLAGRWLGRPALRHAPLKWLVTEADVIRSSRWFNRRGLWLVVATRFMPGTRLPTYVAAGVLRTSALAFTAAFLLAATLWTPLLVGVSALMGGRLLELVAGSEAFAGPAFALGLLSLFVLVRLGVAVFTWRGRRLLLSRWRRLTRWEFWPVWAVYPPVVLIILGLAIRYRSLRLPTLANPGIPGGGLVGESKSAILSLAQGPARERIAPWLHLPGGVPPEERLDAAKRFIAERGLAYPVVVKPDVGERGTGVRFPGNEVELRDALKSPGDLMLQAMVPGREFGIFWYRLPHEPRGKVLAITDKRFPEVVGDGASTLEHLILADDRAVCSARFFLRSHVHRLDEVIPQGERVPLTRLGTHSRGSLFLDGTHLLTPALEEAVERLSEQMQGFWFGRYDVRAPSDEAFQRGEFVVIELNGLSSEATSIYDPRHSVWHAWRVLVHQWRMAFAIGSRHRAAGLRPSGWGELRRLVQRHRAATRATAATPGAPEPVGGG